MNTPNVRNTFLPWTEDTRAQICGMLDATLVDLLALQMMSKQAHWSIRGPWFFARHQLFDDISAHLRTAADQVAERIGTMGGIPHGCARDVSDNTRLPAYPDTSSGVVHIRALASRYGVLLGSLHASTKEAADLGDHTTVDLLTAVGRRLELDLWFLESHLEETDGAVGAALKLPQPNPPRQEAAELMGLATAVQAHAK